MIKDCMAVYREERIQKGISGVLASYTPADGRYIIINPDGSKDEVVIKMDKKTREVDRSSIHFKTVCTYDYYSRYLNSNKAVDPKKIIQSNNYLSFFIKKESLINGKLTEQLIDGYYDILADPYKKYTKPNARALYCNAEKACGPVDLEALEQNRTWVKEHIFNFECEGKDYLKLFFRAEPSLYEQEGRRYLIPNLFNSNDYNLDIEGQIYGLPDNNLGMNAKKPYLDNKGRKVTMPFMLPQEEALLQKEFFDLLLNFNMQGKHNIFIDTGEQRRIIPLKNGEFPPGSFSGIFLRIQKGKTESEIHSQDVISAYHEEIQAFRFENIVNYQKFKDEKYYAEYKVYRAKKEIQALINDIFFNKMLVNHYFTKPEDISIKEGYLKNSLLLARERIFDWLYKGQAAGVDEVLDQVSLELIIGSIERGYWQKAVRQYNLRISLSAYLKGERDMGDIRQEIHQHLFEKINGDKTGGLESDKEYYYAVGQLVQYYISLNKSGKKNHALANPFINAKGDQVLKQKLLQYYKKYNYDIDWKGKRFSNLYAMVSAYQPSGEVSQDDIIAGILSNSLIYEKKEEEK